MPEGPELHIAAQFVRSIGHRFAFGGTIVKSDVSTKNPDVPWKCDQYRIDAVSRGKELKIFLTDDSKKKKPSTAISILFHFGMSGKFEWTSLDDLPKHAHLRFFAKEGNMVLSFVDYRRFGRWFVNADWGGDRGPCIITEAELFRRNVLDHLEDRAFNRPICEVMLNQKFFNGVGNYLRAEVLYRLKIRPFEQARATLAPLAVKVESNGVDKNVATIEKEKTADLLSLTNSLAKEVVSLGFDGGYFSETKDKWESGFGKWLQCYFKDGMQNVKDSNGRTMWYVGEAGPLVPSGRQSLGKKTAKKKVAETAKGEKKPAKKVKKETKVETDTVTKENSASSSRKIKKEEPEEIYQGEVRRSRRLANAICVNH